MNSQDEIVLSLLPDSSKRCIINAAKILDENPELFEPMYELCWNNVPRVSARAMRVINLLAELNPMILNDKREFILDKLTSVTNECILFGALHLFVVIDLPDDDEFLGTLTDTCINLLNRSFERIAVKVYCLDILYRITAIYPEFSSELVHIIRSQMISAPMAIMSRGRKILKKLGTEEYDEFT